MKKIIGCDINPACASLHYNSEKIKVVVGDANSSKVFQEISRLSDTFDIIIDDGSHKSRDIFISFINYFNLLKPEGLYIIEDTHCLYMDGFDGGILNSASVQNFFL